MKLFTIDEANALLPMVKGLLLLIRKHYSVIESFKPSLPAAAKASLSGGGLPGGSSYVKALLDAGRLVSEISDLGVQLKDHSTGLVDFPSMRDGRIVFLCWKLGEPDRIEWWHEIEAGFVGRQPI